MDHNTPSCLVRAVWVRRAWAVPYGLLKCWLRLTGFYSWRRLTAMERPLFFFLLVRGGRPEDGREIRGPR